MAALRPGLTASFLLHLGLLGTAFIVFPKDLPPLSVPKPVIPVDIIATAEVSSVSAARPDAPDTKPIEAAVEAQPEPEPDPMPESQPVRKVTEANATPVAAPPSVRKPSAAPALEKAAPSREKPLVSAQRAPQKTAPKPKQTPPTAGTPQPPRVPTPPAAAKKQAPGFDLDQMAALTDRSVDSAARRAPQMAARAGAFARAERSRAAAGMASELTGALEDSLRSQIARCWRMPPGSSRSSDLLVEIRVYLAADGSLNGTPAMVRPSNLAMVDPALRAAAEGGLRAVRLCQPYQLPAGSYEKWRDVLWSFNPTEMVAQ